MKTYTFEVHFLLVSAEMSVQAASLQDALKTIREIVKPDTEITLIRAV
jgi:hypothetical protein